jgi:hypothetical protein
MKLNVLLYSKLLKCAALWPNLWQYLLNIIDDSLHNEMDILYEKLNQKLHKLQQKHNTTEPKPGRHKQTAYPRTVNLTNIYFTTEELNLLNLGLQHCFHKASYTSWKNLIIERERAVRLLYKLQAPFHLTAAIN